MKTGDMAQEDVRGRKGWRKKEKGVWCEMEINGRVHKEKNGASHRDRCQDGRRTLPGDQTVMYRHDFS